MKWLLVMTGMALLLSACDETDSDIARCDAGIDDVVCGLSATPAYELSDDGGSVYAITIAVDAPALRGGAQANVSTSSGTVAGAPTGMEATVFLAPLGGAPAGRLQGQVELSVPPHRSAQITVHIEQATTSTEVQAP
jgi:hypothetical protein